MKYLLLLIPTEALFFYLGFSVQSFSLINIASLIYLFKVTFYNTKISKILIFLYLYLLFISMIWLNLDFFYDKERFMFFIRQFTALTFGISLYYFFRQIFVLYGKKVVFKYTLFSFYIVIFFAFIEILKGHYFRIESIFTEPSHLGQYLVFLILPIILIMKNENILLKSKFYILFFILILLILLALSATTVLKLFLFVSLYLFYKNNIFNFVIGIFIASIGVLIAYYLLTFLFPNNYMFNMIDLVYSGFNKNIDLVNMPLSLLDRLNFWIALFHSKANLCSLFGYGIGGDYLYGTYFMPDEIYNKISDVKMLGFNMGSFMGKIFIYGGVVGLTTYIYLFYVAIKRSKENIEKALLLSIVLYSSIGMGVFTMVEIWFWLAYVDSRNIRRLKK